MNTKHQILAEEGELDLNPEFPLFRGDLESAQRYIEKLDGLLEDISTPAKYLTSSIKQKVADLKEYVKQKFEELDEQEKNFGNTGVLEESDDVEIDDEVGLITQQEVNLMV